MVDRTILKQIVYDSLLSPKRRRQLVNIKASNDIVLMTDLILAAEIRGTLLFKLHAERAVFFFIIIIFSNLFIFLSERLEQY